MSAQLKRLISCYEAEHRALTAAIDECVAEGEYATAHRLAKGLWRVGRKLQIMKNLHDPLHEQKESTLRRIQGLEELSASLSGRMLDYYLELIATEKQKLADLQTRVPEKSTVPPATALHQALTKLLEVRIAGFTLVLNESERLQLTLKLLRRTLFVMLPEVRRHRAAYTLQKRHIRCLKGLGFRLYDHKDKLLLFLPFGEATAIKEVEIMLARIVFDCFYSGELKGAAAIKYYEPEP